MSDHSHKFAQRMQHLKPSAIREIFKTIDKADIISFAGGMPAKEVLPTKHIQLLAEQVIREFDSEVLQYGVSEGLMPLREALVEYLKKYKAIEAGIENVTVTTGAQGAINATAMLFIDPGDGLAVESPTFLAALKTFKAYQPRLVALPSDEDGLIPSAIDEYLQSNTLKFLYVVPNFQNPTGMTLPLERRQALVDIAEKHDTFIVEDDPYYELRYQGQSLPSLYSLSPGRVLYIGSLSKTMAPGLRVGYTVATEQIADKLVSLKQGIDVHTSNFDQALAIVYLRDGYFEKQIEQTRQLYSQRLQTMLRALSDHMPPDFGWTRPEGGMFIWVTGPGWFDARQAYTMALADKVAYVPGEFFYLDQAIHKNKLRLNFTAMDDSRIKQGIKRLARVIAGFKPPETIGK